MKYYKIETDKKFLNKNYTKLKMKVIKEEKQVLEKIL